MERNSTKAAPSLTLLAISTWAPPLLRYFSVAIHLMAQTVFCGGIEEGGKLPPKRKGEGREIDLFPLFFLSSSHGRSSVGRIEASSSPSLSLSLSLSPSENHSLSSLLSSFFSIFSTDAASLSVAPIRRGETETEEEIDSDRHRVKRSFFPL